MTRQWCAPGAVRREAEVLGETIFANRAAVAGMTRWFETGSVESGRSVRSVMTRSPSTTGSTKLPVKVAPGSSRISSPDRAALSAACRLSPERTKRVSADDGEAMTRSAVPTSKMRSMGAAEARVMPEGRLRRRAKEKGPGDWSGKALCPSLPYPQALVPLPDRFQHFEAPAAVADN